MPRRLQGGCPAPVQGTAGSVIIDGRSPVGPGARSVSWSAGLDAADLAGLTVISGLNLPDPFPPEGKVPWPWVLIVDAQANDQQMQAVEAIFRRVWRGRGEPAAVERAPIEFKKEIAEGVKLPEFTVKSEGLYHLVTSPLSTRDRRPMYFTGIWIQRCVPTFPSRWRSGARRRRIASASKRLLGVGPGRARLPHGASAY